jgi:hypothetical protein
MSSITIVNSANVFARNFIKNLNPGSKKVVLGDIYNSRTSVLFIIK